MYPVSDYTSRGVPCGVDTSSDANCRHKSPIAFLPPGITAEQYKQLDTQISAKLLVDGKHIDEGLLSSVLDTHIDVQADVQMSLTFLQEGACFQNSLGMITWETAKHPSPTAWTPEDRIDILDVGEISIILPNVDDKVCNPSFGSSPNLEVHTG